jgi:hypothetical protein
MEEKLDRIIELLEKIYSALPQTLLQTEPIAEEITTIHKNVKPMPSQLRDKRMVEMVAHSDRNSFMSVWKKGINDLIEIRKTKPGFYPVFQTQALKWFDNHFKKPNHPFYIQLKKETIAYCEAVTKEAQKKFDKLILLQK